MYVCLYVCLWRLGSGSLALPAGIGADLPSTLLAPAKVSRHQSHTPAPPTSPISRNPKVKHCRCLKLDATGVKEALATTTRILLMPHRPRGRRPAEHHSQTNKRLANITFQQRGGVPRTPATANARKGPKTMTCHSEAPRGRQAPQQGGSPLPCGRRPPFAATAPSADAVGRYQRRDLPRSMVSFTKRGSRSRTDPPVTKARLAHTYAHLSLIHI